MGRRHNRRQRHMAGHNYPGQLKVTDQCDPEEIDSQREDNFLQTAAQLNDACLNTAHSRSSPVAMDDANDGNHDNKRLSLKTVAALLASGSAISHLGSDSGIASDCSHSVCNSEEDERDVTGEHDVSSGNISMNVSMDFNDVSLEIAEAVFNKNKDNENEDDDFVVFRDDDNETDVTCDCPKENHVNETITLNCPVKTDATQRPSTPDVTRMTHRRRNAVDHTISHIEYIEEHSDDEGETDGSDVDDDHRSVKSAADSDGCWINSDNEVEKNQEYSSDEESEKSQSDDEDENDCERYCRQYQSTRFEVFGNLDDVTSSRRVPRSRSPDQEFYQDEMPVFGGKPSASPGYGFPRSDPDEIEEVVDFWETDFQVGKYVIPQMSAWDRLGYTPSRDTQETDWNKYMLYKSLYARWVGCNKSQEHWMSRYWGKSLVQIARAGRVRKEKFYPGERTDVITAETKSGLRSASPRETRSDEGHASAFTPVKPACSRSISEESDVIMGCPLGFYDVAAV